MNGEATLDVWGTFSGEAIRPLIQVAALYVLRLQRAFLADEASLVPRCVLPRGHGFPVVIVVSEAGPVHLSAGSPSTGRDSLPSKGRHAPIPDGS
jgi:hypothetical protein